VDTQLNLRETQRAFVALRRNAVPAGKCQFEAATERITIDRSDGWTAEPFKAGKNLLAALSHPRRYLRAAESAKFRHIRAHNETAGFGGLDHNAARQILFEFGQNRVEFVQHSFRKHVTCCTGLVERQPRNIAGIAPQFPVKALIRSVHLRRL
jgi:hypothetical protein